MDQLINHHLHTSSSLSKVFGQFSGSQAACTLARSVCAGEKEALYISNRYCLFGLDCPREGRTKSGGGSIDGRLYREDVSW